MGASSAQGKLWDIAQQPPYLCRLVQCLHRVSAPCQTSVNLRSPLTIRSTHRPPSTLPPSKVQFELRPRTLLFHPNLRRSHLTHSTLLNCPPSTYVSLLPTAHSPTSLVLPYRPHQPLRHTLLYSFPQRPQSPHVYATCLFAFVLPLWHSETVSVSSADLEGSLRFRPAKRSSTAHWRPMSPSLPPGDGSSPHSRCPDQGLSLTAPPHGPFCLPGPLLTPVHLNLLGWCPTGHSPLCSQRHHPISLPLPRFSLLGCDPCVSIHCPGSRSRTVSGGLWGVSPLWRKASCFVFFYSLPGHLRG